MKRSDIYKSIRDRLISKIEGLSVDVQRGQLDKEGYVMTMPLALVSISKIQWEGLAKAFERGVMTVTVDYYKNSVTELFSGSESEESSLDVLNSPNEIYEALANYEVASLFDELYRVEESEIRIGRLLAGYRVVFNAYVYEGE